MSPLERAGYLAHARSAGFLRKVVSARQCIGHALSLGAFYISMSCGKDSSVLASLVLEIAPTTPIRIATCWETRLVHQNLDTCLDWWQERYPKAPLTEVPYRPTRGMVLGPEDLSLPEGRMVAMLNEGTDCVGAFIGLRAKESGNRALSLLHHRSEGRYPIHRYQSGERAGTYRACPLERWDVKDIGAYLTLHGIPILNTYDLEGLDARTTLRLCPEAIRGGVLASLRRRAPADYRALIEAHPELSHL